MKCCCLLCWRATYNSREACSRQISSSTQFRVCSPTACSPLQPCHEVPEKRCAGAVVARSVAIMPGLRSPGRPCNCLQLTACSSPAWLADHTHQDAHICCKPNSRAAGATSGAGRNRRRRLAARAGAGALHSCSLPPPPPLLSASLSPPALCLLPVGHTAVLHAQPTFMPACMSWALLSGGATHAAPQSLPSLPDPHPLHQPAGQLPSRPQPQPFQPLTSPLRAAPAPLQHPS